MQGELLKQGMCYNLKCNSDPERKTGQTIEAMFLLSTSLPFRIKLWNLKENKVRINIKVIQIYNLQTSIYN